MPPPSMHDMKGGSLRGRVRQTLGLSVKLQILESSADAATRLDVRRLVYQCIGEARNEVFYRALPVQNRCRSWVNPSEGCPEVQGRLSMGNRGFAAIVRSVPAVRPFRRRIRRLRVRLSRS